MDDGAYKVKEDDITSMEDDDGSESSFDSEDTTEIETNQLHIVKKQAFARIKVITEQFSNTDANSEKCAPKRKNMIEDFIFLNSLYIKLNNKATLKDRVQFRKEVAKLFIELNLVDFISNIIIKYPIDAIVLPTSAKKNELFREVLHLLLNFTHESVELANVVAKTDVMELCKTILLLHSELYVEDKLTDNANMAVKICIGLVHNVSLRYVNIERLRSLNFVDVLKPFLKPSNDDISLLALTILANIVNEEECSIIESHVLLVARLLWILEKCISTEDRYFSGWSCMELGRAVRNLARNDSNKKLLWYLNALQILINMARKGSEEEILESVHAIWALLFDEEIRKTITTSPKGKGVLELLFELRNQPVDPEIQNVIREALWTLRDLPTTDRRLHTVYPPKVPTHEVAERHIMISYQTSNREVLCRIRDDLKKRKYKVWMDVDDISGSTPGSMAMAVQNAEVVLVCYSRSYKDSHYCRSEAEYAYVCQKPIVPLKMEENYIPDGWLGLVVRAKIYVDFAGKYEYKDMLEKLVKEIRNIKTQPDVEKNVALVAPNKRNETTNSSVIDTIRQWNRDDVIEWLTNNNLTGHGLETLTGEDIAFMVILQTENPEKLHTCIWNDLQITNMHVNAMLFFALRDLPKLQKASKTTTNAGIFQSFCRIL